MSTTEEATTPKRIYPPWSDDVISRLTRFFQKGYMHPYTCPRPHGGEGARDLIATRDGWKCPTCDYKQREALEPPSNEQIDAMHGMHEQIWRHAGVENPPRL